MFRFDVMRSSLRGALVGTLGLLAVLAVVLGAVGVAGMGTIRERAASIQARSMVPLGHLANLHDAELKARMELFGIALADDHAARASWKDGLASDDRDVATALAGYKRSTTLPAAAVTSFEQPWTAYLALRDTTMIPLAQQHERSAFLRVQQRQAQPLLSKAADALDALQVAEQRLADRRAAAAGRAYRSRRAVLLTVLVLGLLLTGLAAVALVRRVGHGVSDVLAAVAALAAGDLTHESRGSRSDELGRIAAQLDAGRAGLRDALATVATSARALADAAVHLRGSSRQISVGTRTATTSIEGVSAAAEQVSRNVQTVATGAEEMTASIAEIARNVAQASAASSSAVGLAADATATVARLGASSAEIGSVVALITTIAEQTNLLALNATIEAARAGDAGKGFAVVAGEVKDLAHQTSAATGDIAGRITAIQADVAAAVAAISRISAAIESVDGYQETIASAVEEQSATTSEMSRNVAEAATGTTSIALSVGGVADTARGTEQDAGESLRAAEELAAMGAALHQAVDAFVL